MTQLEVQEVVIINLIKTHLMSHWLVLEVAAHVIGRGGAMLKLTDGNYREAMGNIWSFTLVCRS